MKRYFTSVVGSHNSKSSNVGSSSIPIPINLPSNPDLSNCEVEAEAEVDVGVGCEVDNLSAESVLKKNVEVDVDNLPADPGLRKDISEYSVNDREKVRRAYLQKGPCQPRNHAFPITLFGVKRRRFVAAWFNDYSNWLEYSISKDALYSLPCYLFKPDHGDQGGGDSFVGEGYRNWKKKDRLDAHIGSHNSIHSNCLRACEDLMSQKQHIEVSLTNYSAQSRIDYRARLIASIDCIRLLLHQGLAFRGHDESEESNNQGNFLEFLHFLADHNQDVKKVVLGNAPENLKMTSPKIQKDIINSIATEITNAIIREMDDGLFSILVDEARDISVKEQMAVVLRFVDARGCIVERFLGVVHVGDTTAMSLKISIEALFSKYGLSILSLRGQGYDGASNMRGEFNGLKSLIMRENECTYYIHCFAHQLQLALVTVAESHYRINKFFDFISRLINVVSASCKRKDMLREKSSEQVLEGLQGGEISSGKGKNQEVSLGRPGTTRWGSHYRTLVNLTILFDPTVDVLMAITSESKGQIQRTQAEQLLDYVQSFEFVFCLFLMMKILGVSNDLSQALQKKDQDIVNAVSLVRITKQVFQQMREEGWDLLWEEVASFCTKRNIIVPNLEASYVIQGRPRRNVEECTNMHLYRFDLFNNIIDLQLQELNDRFNEVNTELLLCMACLNPREAFSAFDKRKLIRFAEFYPNDYSASGLVTLGHQLDCYIVDMRSDDQFANLSGIRELSKKLVQVKKHHIYHQVYLLVKLALILPVATATVERVFSAMKLVKCPLRNRLGDDMMNDCLIAYIEKDIARSIDIEDILERFQGMAPRKTVILN